MNTRCLEGGVLQDCKRARGSRHYPKATPNLLCELVPVTLSIWALGSSVFKGWGGACCMCSGAGQGRMLSILLHLSSLDSPEAGSESHHFAQLSWLVRGLQWFFCLPSCLVLCLQTHGYRIWTLALLFTRQALSPQGAICPALRAHLQVQCLCSLPGHWLPVLYVVCGEEAQAPIKSILAHMTDIWLMLHTSSCSVSASVINS